MPDRPDAPVHVVAYDPSWPALLEVEGEGDDLRLGRAGIAWCRRVGIDRAGLLAGRRRPCRPCLDWSERRSHPAGVDLPGGSHLGVSPVAPPD